MLHVTSQAKSELHGMLMQALADQPEEHGLGIGLRLVSGKGDYSTLGLTLDAPREGDEIVEHDGRSVLMLDPSTSKSLEDFTLDVVKTSEGSRLQIRK